MRPRIAIPLPHSTDLKYGEQALPQYMQAVEMAGGEPVRIPLDQPPAQVMKLIERCDAVLLPGSNADVDPAKFKASRHSKTESADPRRDAVDELLLRDAYDARKPVLGICYGLQILNVYRSGTLLQHIESPVNHEAGRKVAVAHMAEIEPQSKLARIVATGAEAPNSAQPDIPRLKLGASTVARTAPPGDGSEGVRTALSGDASEPPRHASELPGDGSKASTAVEAAGTVVETPGTVVEAPGTAVEAVGTAVDSTRPSLQAAGTAVEAPGFSRGISSAASPGASAPGGTLVIPVNSSHHQSAEVIGEGLRIVARCPDDGIIEAVEGTADDHFVLAVQWHPERSTDDARSRAIFRALIEAAKARHKQLAGEFEPV